MGLRKAKALKKGTLSQCASFRPSSKLSVNSRYSAFALLPRPFHTQSANGRTASCSAKGGFNGVPASITRLRKAKAYEEGHAATMRRLSSFFSSGCVTGIRPRSMQAAVMGGSFNGVPASITRLRKAKAYEEGHAAAMRRLSSFFSSGCVTGIRNSHRAQACEERAASTESRLVSRAFALRRRMKKDTPPQCVGFRPSSRLAVSPG